jgi:uncharacterized NAD(P)/FAD-binding protein YdhS
MRAILNNKKRHVAIIGGGIAGVAAFIEIVRTSVACDVSIIDPRSYGGGDGFRASDGRLLCNTSVETMSALYGQCHDFREYLHSNGHPASADDFVPRRIAFQYVKTRYEEACEEATRLGIGRNWIKGTAFRIDLQENDLYRIALTNGRSVTATHVLICTGHGEPYVPNELRPYLAETHVYRCPYPEAGLLSRLAPRSRVLVLGGRLSAIDAALVLCGEGHTAVLASPSGQLPAVRTACPMTPRVKMDAEALQALDPCSDRFRRSLLRLFSRAIFPISARTLSEQTCRSLDPIDRLYKETNLARDGKVDWQYSIGQFLEAGNQALVALEPDIRQIAFPQIMSICGRYLFAFPLRSAEAILKFAEEGRFSIRADRFKEMASAPGGSVVSFYSGHTDTFHAIVCATGYEKRRVWATGNSFHLFPPDGEEAAPAHAAPDLRLSAKDGYAPEKIWLCGACAYPAAPLESAVYQFVRQAHSIVATLGAEDPILHRSSSSHEFNAAREGLLQ